MRHNQLILLALIGLVVTVALAPPASAAHSDRGCRYCHTPHNAGDPNDPNEVDAYGVPLWANTYLSDGLPTYTLYDSKTLDATLEQPDGPSRLCLGCHDGSYEAIFDDDAVFEANDLVHSHPISFVYDASLIAADEALKDPVTALSGLGGTISQDLLDEKEKMQCTSCHDVHSSGFGDYQTRVDISRTSNGLTDPIGNDQKLCKICHIK